MKFFWKILIGTFFLLGLGLSANAEELNSFTSLKSELLYRSEASSEWIPLTEVPRSVNLFNPIQHYWLKVDLSPIQLKTKKWLYFESMNEVLSLSMDGKLVYKLGNVFANGDLQLPGTSWHRVYLHRKNKTQTLLFEVHSYHRLVSLSNSIILATEGHIYRRVIENGYPPFFLGGLFLAMAFYILLVFYHPSLSIQHSSLFIFVFSVGMVIMSRTPFNQFVYDSPIFWEYILTVFFVLIPLALGIFVTQAFDFPLSKSFRKFLTFQLGSQILFLLCCFLKVWPLGYFNLLTLVFLLVDAVFIVWGTLYCAFKRNKLALLFVFGFSIYFGTVFASAILILFVKTNSLTQTNTYWGAFCFSLTLVLILRSQIIATYKEQEVAIEANHQKNVFLANMSHELRTPLNSIIGFSNILLKNKEENLSNKEMNYLSRLLANGKHLLSLVDHILDISKIEAGKMEAQLTLVPLQELIDKILNTIPPLMEKQDNHFEIVNQIPSGFTFETDLNWVYQILLNLLSNAAKFTESGAIQLAVSLAGNELRFKVKDNGVGVKVKDIDTLFNAFSQVEQGYNRQYEGTGLGLVISQRFTHLLQGRIEVESEYEKGSIFTLILPLRIK